MAYYLKYRPQTVNDLDSDEIRTQFVSLFSKQDFPHAFLFTGTRGIGKTSTARIIAKIVNCTKGALKKKKWEFTEPCNKCEMCQAITKGNSLDILEIDAASNRGIDEMRSLREKINLSPSQAKYKVYIIDEVHMLTTEAFNALLKTLEEPPKHALFILCTTERHKVPDTIASRCTTVVFKKANEKELLRSLKRVVKGEGITIGDEALKSIAGFSDGSFRDATKTLEQLTAGKSEEIKADDVKKMLFSADINEEELVRCVLDKKVKEALETVQKSVELGVDPKQLNLRLLSVLRIKLLEEVAKRNKSEEISNLTKLIRLLSKAEGEIKYVPIGQLPIELAIVDYCYSK